jgi:hypothetical protein
MKYYNPGSENPRCINSDMYILNANITPKNHVRYLECDPICYTTIDIVVQLLFDFPTYNFSTSMFGKIVFTFTFV